MLEYIASGNIPVRVGQSAKENDYLTTTSVMREKNFLRMSKEMRLY
jgi:predicted ribosome quality control (RQC) complex YloA/Tae2 family protein